MGFTESQIERLISTLERIAAVEEACRASNIDDIKRAAERDQQIIEYYKRMDARERASELRAQEEYQRQKEEREAQRTIDRYALSAFAKKIVREEAVSLISDWEGFRADLGGDYLDHLDDFMTERRPTHDE